MTMSKMKLVCALTALTVPGVMGQEDGTSCVKLDAVQLSSCPCDEATLTFSLQKKPLLNLAVVVDGSSSITSSEFVKVKEFASAFWGEFPGFFVNGEKASYVQYADILVSSGTFDTMQAYETYVNADAQSQSSATATNIAVGIEEGTEVLGNDDAIHSIMVVVTGSKSSNIDDSKAAADAARAAGIEVYAVGVGDGDDATELEYIGGDIAHVFTTSSFNQIPLLMFAVVQVIQNNLQLCSAVDATLTITFSVPVDSTTSGSISGNTVTFSAAELTSDPTELDVMLRVCREVPGGSVIVSVNYSDDEGNNADLSLLTGLVVGEDVCGPPGHHQRHPKRGRHLWKGKAKHSTYMGCYVNDSRHRPLDGPISSSDHMTAQMCADKCSSSGHGFFGTSSSDCRCGSSKPSKKGGVCDYECSGDHSRACGGVESMSIYESDSNRGRGKRRGGGRRGRGN